MSENVTDFQWSENKLSVAQSIAEGKKTYAEIAEEHDINERTIYRWKEKPEFMKKVDELTLECELASRAGILRQLFKGAEIKSKNIEDDKNTLLDYLKEIGDLQGLKKQKVEQDINITGEMNVTAKDELIRRIDSIASKIGTDEDSESTE